MPGQAFQFLASAIWLSAVKARLVDGGFGDVVVGGDGAGSSRALVPESAVAAGALPAQSKLAATGLAPAAAGRLGSPIQSAKARPMNWELPCLAQPKANHPAIAAKQRKRHLLIHNLLPFSQLCRFSPKLPRTVSQGQSNPVKPTNPGRAQGSALKYSWRDPMKYDHGNR